MMEESIQRLKALHRADIFSKTTTTGPNTELPLLLHIRGLSEFATQGAQAYSDLAQKTDLVREFISIISSSSDQVVDECFKLLAEFTELEEEGEHRALQLQLINQMLDFDLPQVCIAHGRFISDTGHGLEFIANLCEIYPSASPEHLAERTELISKLVLALKADRVAGEVRLACSELLAVVLHASARARQDCDVRELLCLLPPTINYNTVLSVEEEEVLENVVDCLCRLVLNSHEDKLRCSMESALHMMKHQLKPVKRLGFKLSAALVLNCEENARKFVDLGGLKSLFIFTQRDSTSAVKRARLEQDETRSSALSLLASLCLQLPTGQYQDRLIAKLREPGKLPTLVDLYQALAQQVADRLRELEEDEEFDEEEEYLDLAEHGLTELEWLCIILASAREQIAGGDVGMQQRVLLECAERALVLDRDGTTVLEAPTLALKSKLVALAAKTNET